jgi:predicted phage baseplate assembly protein
MSNCDCCTGIGPSTPGVVFNRPGLSAIAYRSGTWHEFKDSLLAALADSQHPELAGLATRADDDFSIALLDAVATVGDVLSFYSERIANESYLRTATERVSVLELARLIGYELKPGVAAETLLAFTVDDAIGSPGVATIDVGLRVQSVPGHNEKPQTFETVEGIEARLEWNAMKPKKTIAQTPASMSSELWLAGTATNLTIGDVILLVGAERENSSSDEHWDVRRVASVVPDFNTQTTHVTLGAQVGTVDSSVSPSASPKAYAMRTRASVFGYNAPEWRAMSADFKANYTGNSNPTDSEWPDFTTFYVDIIRRMANVGVGIGLGIKNLEGSLIGEVAGSISEIGGAEIFQITPPRIFLDQAYPQIVENSWAVVANPDAVEVYQVVEAVTSARADYAISGKSTRLRLTGQNYDKFAGAVRTTTVYAQSELLTLAERPINPPIASAGVSALLLDRDIGDLPDGRALLLAGTSATDGSSISESIVLDHAESSGGVTRLVFTSALANSYVLGSLTIYGNVAKATQGETVSEVLGGGDASKKYQKLGLRQSPLTFVRSPSSPTGIASTLELRVNDLLWTEVPYFYGRKPDERVYTTRLDDDGNTVVKFGDGIHGARVPTGQENIRAKYRKGVGTGGNVRSGQLSTLLTRPLGLKGALNPQPASGGDEAEARDSAGENAPITVLVLDRVVSLQDYEDFARGYAGIAKALATWTWDGQTRGVFVTVAGPDGTPVSADVVALLTGAIRAAGDPFVPLRVASYRPASFNVSFKMKVDPAFDKTIVTTAVVDALRSHFGFSARAFGQPVSFSEVVAAIQDVAGVVAVDLDLLRRTDTFGFTLFGAVPSLPAALPQADSLAGTLAAELLTLSDAPIVPGDMP